MLKRALCFFLLKGCGSSNDIISFFGPQLQKCADPCYIGDLMGHCYMHFAFVFTLSLNIP